MSSSRSLQQRGGLRGGCRNHGGGAASGNGPRERSAKGGQKGGKQRTWRPRLALLDEDGESGGECGGGGVGGGERGSGGDGGGGEESDEEDDYISVSYFRTPWQLNDCDIPRSFWPDMVKMFAGEGVLLITRPAHGPDLFCRRKS